MSQESSPLSHASPKIHGLLLAAGRGRRFDPEGKRHKLLARSSKGESLILESVHRLLPWVDDLTVVVGPHSSGLVRELAGLSLNVVVCSQADQGPGASLRFGIAASMRQRKTSDAAGCLIALADMPFIAPETYQILRMRLMDGISSGQANVWRPVFEDMPGHPVGVPAIIADRYLASQSGLVDPARGLAVLWRNNPDVLCQIPVKDAGCIQDVDRPEDLR